MSRGGSPRNSRLDSFLKRNTERTVYEGIGACEPCVVVSETVNKVYMHAVLGDDRLYLTEYPPRTLVDVFTFGRVRDIELVSSIFFLSLFSGLFFFLKVRSPFPVRHVNIKATKCVTLKAKVR